MTSFCHDAFSRFVYIVSKGNKSRPWILPEDLAPLIQDVVGKYNNFTSKVYLTKKKNLYRFASWIIIFKGSS